MTGWTWRRAPLAATTLLPIVQTITLRGGRQRQVAWTDEQVTLNDYGKPVRQLSLFGHQQDGRPGDQRAARRVGAELRGWLRGRWAEENMFKYDMINYGLDTLADYDADEVVNTKLKANPAFTTAKKAETKAKTALANAEVALAKLLADPAIAARNKNDELIPPRPAEDHSLQAGAGASPGPSARGTPRSCPPARSTRPRPARSCTSTGAACNWSCAFWPPNAEHYLARHLNAYLQDDDEYRAITRESIIRGLSGTITYKPKNITVTLDQPGQGRVTRALTLLIAEINTRPPALPGNGRPITYTLRQSQ